MVNDHFERSNCFFLQNMLLKQRITNSNEEDNVTVNYMTLTNVTGSDLYVQQQSY